MAPPCVILKRRVRFVAGPLLGIAGTSGDTEGSTGGANKEAAAIGGQSKAAAAAIGGPEMPMEVILEAMKPDPGVFDPPEVSHLHMVRQMKGGLHGGMISSTDEGLVVLYAGHYQPGFTTTPSSGCYLVYNASSNSLFAIPQLPDDYTFSALGRGAAILSSGEGKYVLAELVATHYQSDFPDAALFLWQCPNLTDDQWIRKAVRLPSQAFDPDYSFNIDMAFSYAGSSICWVDLLKGVLVCNLLKPTEPELTFVPLPEGYTFDLTEDMPRPRPQEFRTMGCVNGVIKFVAVVGYYEGWNINDLMLKSWSLTPDLKKWKAGTPLPLRDLWASESFRGRHLPQIAPLYPVISINKDEVVYVVLNEVDLVRACDIYGRVVDMEIVRKAQHVLRLDMIQKKVLHSTKVIPNSMTPRFPDLIASEFSAYLQS